MRPLRLLVAIGLACLLAAPGGGAQSSPAPTVDTRALVDGEPLAEASPVEPGTPIAVSTNVSTQSGNGTEWRAFANASIPGGPNETRSETWTGADDVGLDLTLEAPQAEDTYTLDWNVTVQSRNASDPDALWSDADRVQETVGFQVRQPAPPPSASDVSVTVATGGGTDVSQLGNLTPGERILLDGDVTLPERENTQWNVSIVALVNGTRVDRAQQRTSSGGSIPFALTFNAPGTAGTHELRWEVVVEYRDAGDETWTSLTTREDTASFTVQTLQPPPGPGLPWGWILGVGAVVAAGGVGAYYVLREPPQIKGEPKSQAMQDLEGEPSPEPGEPEVHPQVKILEARAEDLRRMIELARERHEQGEITEHQFEQIRERKEADLEEVEAEIEQYRQESTG